MSKSLWGMGLSLLVAAGCSSDEGPTFALPFCTGSGARLNLAVGSCNVVDPLVTGDSAVFPANTTGSQMEYVLVPFSASTTPDDSGDFMLQGAIAAAAPVAPAVAAMTRSPASPPEEFHLFLRRAERDRFDPLPQSSLAPQAQPAPPEPQAAVTLTPADSGTIRSFKVCGDLKCDSVPTVRAVLMKIGRHIAIYVDSAAPQPGLTQSDLDAIRDVIDNRLYVVDTLAFGRESDIDANHVVLVLMTNRVNRLVTAAERSEEHTSELQSQSNLVCRLLLEKKKTKT